MLSAPSFPWTVCLTFVPAPVSINKSRIIYVVFMKLELFSPNSCIVTVVPISKVTVIIHLSIARTAAQLSDY